MAEPITEALDHIVDFSAIDGVSCPCGTSRRAFTDLADFPATIHQVEISSDAKLHYHKHQTEAITFCAVKRVPKSNSMTNSSTLNQECASSFVPV